MFRTNGPNLFSPIKYCASCLALLALCGVALAQTQHAAAKTHPLLKYDLKAEKKIKGVVQEVKQTGQGRAELIHLVLKNGTDTINVYLCPQSFLKDMGIELKPGDEVEVTGSPAIENGVSVILAREIDKGSDSYVLRDDKGVPVWNWQHT
ncbi:MAG TPA: OB-fold nucleic acid binding domain-containing protein [Terriglobales bacterium]|nr:OB-fold nucleic acid binding domain-containing protein [Terriglobales bacterium]